MLKRIIFVGTLGAGMLGACQPNSAQTQQSSEKQLVQQAVATPQVDPKVGTPEPAGQENDASAPAEPAVDTAAPTHSKADNSPPTYLALPDFGDVASARVYSFSLKRSTDSYWANASDKLADECHQYPIQKDGSTCRRDTTSVVLSAKQLKSVLALFTTTSTYGPSGAGAGCFDPRHAFGFFDESGELIAQIGICIDCNNLRVTPPIEPIIKAAVEVGYERPAKDRKFIGTAIGHEGLSAFRDLCREVGLDRCDRSTWLQTIND